MNDQKITKSNLENTVRGFLDNKQMFTAYDVTLKTRKRMNVEMRHKDLRSSIHQLELLSDIVDFGYDTGDGPEDWKRTKINLPNDQWVFVYHLSTDDPEDYQGYISNADFKKASSIVASSDTDSDSGGFDGLTYKTDYRQRLLVPKSFFDLLTVQPASTIYLLAYQESDKSDRCVLLIKDLTADLRMHFVKNVVNDNDSECLWFIGKQLLEKYGDLRLSKKNLSFAGCDVSEAFCFENKTLNLFGIDHEVIVVKNVNAC